MACDRKKGEMGTEEIVYEDGQRVFVRCDDADPLERPCASESSSLAVSSSMAANYACLDPLEEGVQISL